MSQILKSYVENYFINNSIPLVNSRGNSNVILAIYGYRRAKMGGNAVSRFCKLYFPNKPSRIQVYKYILKLTGDNYCIKCDNIVKVKDFSTGSICKKCDSERYKLYYENNKEKVNKYKQQHYIDNKGQYSNRDARRRVAKLNRTVSWDQEGIKEFYINCPEGNHVDHIIPLQGKLISGLHVLSNLQYLTVKENLKKSNKWGSEGNW